MTRAEVRERALEILRLVGINEPERRYKQYPHELSGGMKQKLGLACALLGDPKFLVLDEPSVGVDPISRRDLMRLVRATIKEDTTVVWSTAYLDEANSFDNTVVIDKAKSSITVLRKHWLPLLLILNVRSSA